MQRRHTIDVGSGASKHPDEGIGGTVYFNPEVSTSTSCKDHEYRLSHSSRCIVPSRSDNLALVNIETIWGVRCAVSDPGSISINRNARLVSEKMPSLREELEHIKSESLPCLPEIMDDHRHASSFSMDPSNRQADSKSKSFMALFRKSMRRVLFSCGHIPNYDEISLPYLMEDQCDIGAWKATVAGDKGCEQRSRPRHDDNGTNDGMDCNGNRVPGSGVGSANMSVGT
jgi:hypothetical protein